MEEIIIPIAFFATVVLIVYFTVKYNNKTKKMEHEERMLAIEKGVAMPEMPKKKKQKEYNSFMSPFILIGIGLGFLAVWIFDTGWSTFGGYIAFFMGVGMLAAHLLNQKYKKKSEEKELDSAVSLPDTIDTESKL